MMPTTSRDQAPHHPLFARLWPRIAAQLDAQGATEHRQRLVSGLEGRVVEIGAGDGRSFAHYPRAVSEVVAVEPEPYLRERAEETAGQAPVAVTVVDGVAEALPAADDSFDAAVSAVVLCSVGDQHAALGEIARVLRPGGWLRFFEHVAADGRAQRGLQRTLDATVWPRLLGGCHTARDTLTSITETGFRLGDLTVFRFPDGALPTRRHRTCSARPSSPDHDFSRAGSRAAARALATRARGGGTAVTDHPALRVRGLRTSYGAVVALDSIDLDIARGEIVGLLGHNGAGKTTLVSSTAGLRRPEAGTIAIDGIDGRRDPVAARRRLGYAPQETGVYPDASVRDNLEVFGALAGLGRRRRAPRSTTPPTPSGSPR